MLHQFPNLFTTTTFILHFSWSATSNWLLQSSFPSILGSWAFYGCSNHLHRVRLDPSLTFCIVCSLSSLFYYSSIGVVCHVPLLFQFSKIHLKNLCIRIPLTSSCLRHHEIHCKHARELMLVSRQLQFSILLVTLKSNSCHASLSYLWRDATTHNIVAPTVLRVVASLLQWCSIGCNNSQQHATKCSRVCKRTQHVASNNVASVCSRLNTFWALCSQLYPI